MLTKSNGFVVGFGGSLLSNPAMRGFAMVFTGPSINGSVLPMMAERLRKGPGVEILNDVVLNQVLVRFRDRIHARRK
jgi:hypothetical protein